MQNERNQFSLFEQIAVVAIILLVSAMTIQNVLYSMRASEERTVNDAVADYATVKSMYAEQGQVVLPSVVSRNVNGAANLHGAPIQ